MKIPEDQIGQLAQDASRDISQRVMRAVANVGDAEQRYVLVTQIAAALFGTAGAAFQDFNPGSNKEEAARATLAHIGSLLGAYTQ